MSEVRTRIAPSPTGDLHIGVARTALFSYLYARHNKGKFCLRIEDTDRERSTQQSVESILNGFKWLGLDYDEGPIFQSDRLDLYRKQARVLLDKGLAYEDTNEKGTALRLKMPKGPVTFHDEILGEVTQEGYDFVILKSDGWPTYNFAVVVDDHDMGITHVVRGNDLMASTPLQMALYTAFGWQAPKFAHLPMILGEDGQKMSKRHGATSVIEYKEMGFLPQAVVNYLTLLAWSPGNDQELISLEETIAKFDFDRVRKSPSRFDMKKITWLNSEYVKQVPTNALAELLIPFWQKAGIPVGPKDPRWVHRLVDIHRERLHLLTDARESIRIFMVDDTEYNEDDVKKILQKPGVNAVLRESKQVLENVPSYEGESAHKKMDADLHAVAEKMALGFGKVAQPIRVAITGSKVSPGLYDTIELLGREKVLSRLDHAIANIAKE